MTFVVFLIDLFFPSFARDIIPECQLYLCKTLGYLNITKMLESDDNEGRTKRSFGRLSTLREDSQETNQFDIDEGISFF
jgi:hypothetical protein